MVSFSTSPRMVKRHFQLCCYSFGWLAFLGSDKGMSGPMSIWKHNFWNIFYFWDMVSCWFVTASAILLCKSYWFPKFWYFLVTAYHLKFGPKTFSENLKSTSIYISWTQIISGDRLKLDRQHHCQKMINGLYCSKHDRSYGEIQDKFHASNWTQILGESG